MANLRNRIAILDDITKMGLDPAKAHSALQKDGHLKSTSSNGWLQLLTDLATDNNVVEHKNVPVTLVIQQEAPVTVEETVEAPVTVEETVEAPVTVEETVEAPVTKLQRKNNKKSKK